MLNIEEVICSFFCRKAYDELLRKELDEEDEEYASVSHSSIDLNDTLLVALVTCGVFLTFPYFSNHFSFSAPNLEVWLTNTIRSKHKTPFIENIC